MNPNEPMKTVDASGIASHNMLITMLILVLVIVLISSNTANANLNTRGTYAWYIVTPEIQKIGEADALSIVVPSDAYGKVLKYIAVKSSDAAVVEEDEVPKKKIKFAAVGDVSCNNRSYKMLAEAIKQYEPDKVLLLGDYSYRVDDARCFTDVFSFPSDKVIAVHGNHDNHYWNSMHRPTYGLMMEMRKAYDIPASGSYYVKYHNIAFIIIDNSLAKSPKGITSIDEHSATYALARYNLGMAGIDKGIEWRIAMMHIPLDVKATEAVASVREPYAMMLDGAGVDVVLSGDTHHYTRTYPLKGINTVVSREKSSYDFSERHGRIQYIVGTGGADQSNADEIKGVVAASIGRERLRNNPAYLQIEITNDAENTRMNTRLVDINGNVYDEVSIVKKRSTGKASVQEIYLYVNYRNVGMSYGRFFDGSNGRMAMLRHDDRMNGDELSIALWFLSETKGSNRPAVLLEKGNPLVKTNVSLLIGIDSNGAVVYEWDGSDGKRYSMRSGNGINYADSRWHHLALVRNGASVVMYVDGKPIAESREIRAMPVKNSYDVYINAMPDYSYTAKAMVDAIGIWNRALSAGEVLSLYSGGSAVMSDAMAYELVNGREGSSSGSGNANTFRVNSGESIVIRWHNSYDGRGSIIVISNGIYMQSWQSLFISRAFIHGAYGSMYHEVVFGFN